MKLFKNNLLFSGTACLAIFLYSCSREIPTTAYTEPSLVNRSTVQVINGTVKAARNYVYVDGTPVSGAAFAYGGTFPATAYSFNVLAGMRSFLIKDTLSTATQAQMSFSENFMQGGNYTIFMYDTITSAKHITVLNDFVQPKDTTSLLRFANFVYNTTPVASVDVYSFRRGTTPVFTNVATNTVTNFIPYASGLTDTLYVYASGTTSPLLVKSLVSSLTPTRVYTSLYSGSYRGTKALTTFVNY